MRPPSELDLPTLPRAWRGPKDLTASDDGCHTRIHPCDSHDTGSDEVTVVVTMRSCDVTNGGGDVLTMGE